MADLARFPVPSSNLQPGCRSGTPDVAGLDLKSGKIKRVSWSPTSNIAHSKQPERLAADNTSRKARRTMKPQVEPIGYHLQHRLVNDRIIAPTPEERRILSRVVLKQGRQDSLLAFGLADAHLHQLPLCSRQAAGRLAQRVEAALKLRLHLPVGFAPFNAKPIYTVWHLSQAFLYVLTQYERHGLDWELAHEATNLPDLLGLRLVGRYTRANVARALPRVKRADLLGCLQVSQIEPTDNPLDAVLEAACAASCLPNLAGSSSEAVAARRAVIEVVRRRVPPKDLAEQLGIARRTLSWLRNKPVAPDLVRAIRLQLGLRAERATLPTPGSTTCWTKALPRDPPSPHVGLRRPGGV